MPESFLFKWLRPMLIIWCSLLSITFFYCLFLIFFHWMCVGIIIIIIIKIIIIIIMIIIAK